MSVVVVGGGLSGLFTASELMAAGVEDVVVVEKSDRPGGVARTITENGFTFDPAVGAMTLPHPHLSPLLARLGIDMVPAARAGSVRQVYTGGRLISISPSPKAILAPIVPWTAKLRALAEPMLPLREVHEESLADFCRRRFGRRAGELIAWLMASGVFAGDPERLSAAAAFPALVRLEQDAGSVTLGAVARRRRRDVDAPLPRLHYPAGGMANLSRMVAESLGERYRSGFEAESVRRERGNWVVSGTETLRSDSVVLATGPGMAAKLVDDELAGHLREAKSVRVVVVGLGGSGDALPRGFGALVGPAEGMVSRGLLYESSYAPDRAPGGCWLLKVIASGATVEGPSGDVALSVLREAEIVLGRVLSPTFMTTVDDLPGIPQYEVGHLRWLDRLDGLLARRQGLHVTGWGYRGVGVAHLATDAVRLRGVVSGN